MNTLRWKRLYCRLFGHGAIVSHITSGCLYSHDSCYRCGRTLRIESFKAYMQWTWEQAYEHYPENWKMFY